MNECHSFEERPAPFPLCVMLDSARNATSSSFSLRFKVFITARRDTRSRGKFFIFSFLIATHTQQLLLQLDANYLAYLQYSYARDTVAYTHLHYLQYSLTNNTIACTSYTTVTNYVYLPYDYHFLENKYLNYLHYY